MFPLLQICWLALACPDSAFFTSYMSSFCALGCGDRDSWQGPLGLLRPPARIFCIKFVLTSLGSVVCSPSPPTPLPWPLMEPLGAPDFGWVLCPPSLPPWLHSLALPWGSAFALDPPQPPKNHTEFPASLIRAG